MATTPILVSMGDPAGIGGEITLKAWATLRNTASSFAVVGDPDWLRDIASSLEIDSPVTEVSDLNSVAETFAEALPVLPLPMPVAGRPGEGHREDGVAIELAIRRCVDLALTGKASAIVTNPINKKVLYDSGFSFPGHTEFIADLCDEDAPVMMLASPSLRVVPVTIHTSLRTAIDSLSRDAIVETSRIVAEALEQDFALTSPRIAISGLNPHAGEDGTLGYEDELIIEPAIDILRADGIDVLGPVPGDALFTPRMRETYDVAVCMYHDQALIPIKALDFDRAVNVTLGLPVVRTSPGHGTAYDIAGKGIAAPESLISAIKLADEIASNRRRTSTRTS